MDKVPELLQLSRENKARFFIQFGGQGNSFLLEMKALYSKWPELEDFFQTVFLAIHDFLERPDIERDREKFYPYGFDLKKWLNNEDLPPSEYLYTAPISFPSNMITQLAYYYLVDKMGLNMKEILANTVALTGHSQGLQAAVAVGLGKSGDEFLEIAYKFIKWFAVAGYMMQDVYGIVKVPPEMEEKSVEMDGQKPTCMVVCSGMKQKDLQQLLDDFNRQNSHYHLEIALYNSPTFFVLSGHLPNIFYFRKEHFDLWQEKNWGWNYLDVSAPFHRDGYVSDAAPRLLNDEVSLEIPYLGKDLVVPVISYYTGKNLQTKGHLIPLMTFTLIDKPLYWKKAIAPLLNDQSITHVLDFGPGKISSMLTKSYLNKESPVQVLSVTGSTGVKKALKEAVLE